MTSTVNSGPAGGPQLTRAAASSAAWMPQMRNLGTGGCPALGKQALDLPPDLVGDHVKWRRSVDDDPGRVGARLGEVTVAHTPVELDSRRLEPVARRPRRGAPQALLRLY